jgi:hypothetical protein
VAGDSIRLRNGIGSVHPLIGFLPVTERKNSTRRAADGCERVLFRIDHRRFRVTGDQ